MLAQIGKSDRQLVAHLIAHRTADVDATRLGKALQLRSQRNAVAIDRLTIAQHIAAIDANAKPDLALLRHIGGALGHRVLDCDRALHCIDHAGELDEQAVAHRPHGAPAVFENFRIDNLAPDGVESRERSLIVDAHQP